MSGKPEKVKSENLKSSGAEIFPSVLGQFNLKQQIARILSGDRLAHAYLFTGSEGSGRLSMALEIARTLNCTNADVSTRQYGCECNSCRHIYSWQHPNLYPVFPLPRLDKLDENKEPVAQKVLQEILSAKAENCYAPLKLTETGRILVDQIRELRAKLALAMDRPGVRTMIIQPAERMRDEAANAFLKLLEEPPDNCCLILCTESTRYLLPTIVSRCQVIKFPPLSRTEIREGLIDRFDLTPDAAETAARLSMGNFTRAMGFADGEISNILQDGLEFLRAAVAGNAPKVTKIAELSSREERSAVNSRLSYTATWIRDALAWKAFGSEDANRFLAGGNQDNATEKMASKYNNKQLYKTWQAIEEARQIIDENVNVSLVLIALSVKIQRIMG